MKLKHYIIDLRGSTLYRETPRLSPKHTSLLVLDSIAMLFTIHNDAYLSESLL